MKFVKFVEVEYTDKDTNEVVNTVQALFVDNIEGALMQSLTDALQEACQSMKIVIGKDGYGKLVAQQCDGYYPLLVRDTLKRLVLT